MNGFPSVIGPTDGAAANNACGLIPKAMLVQPPFCFAAIFKWLADLLPAFTNNKSAIAFDDGQRIVWFSFHETLSS